jgi:hypothetical protein
LAGASCWRSWAVLDELVANPQWLVKQAKSLNPILAKGLEAVLDVLRRRADERLTPAVAAEIVKAAVRAVALRVEFLAASAGQPLVALAIDLLLGVLFDEQRTAAQAWQLLRAGVISALAEAALRALAQSKLRAAEIEVFREVLTAEIEALDGGRALDVRAFESKLRERLLAA